MINTIINWIKFNLIGKLLKKPTNFGWNVADFEALRLWAQFQPHPHSKDLSLWDSIKDNDSLWTMSRGERILR
jgi:hypothetical protein